MTDTGHHQALPVGYRLHWYEIRSVLGQGGFGITYLAKDTNLDTEVAVKEFLPGEIAVRAADATVRPATRDRAETYGWGLNRFLSEARTLARFRHPNIVKVLAVFEENNTAYMVMEYEHGESLDEAFRRGRVATQTELLRVLLPLLDGLGKVHEHGFIHRDIKPANIFLRADGTPVLLDFGSARQAVGSETRTLTALVSPGYAPFEQYQGGRDSDRQGPWSDIYSLGATLYRAVTGKGPPDALLRADALLDGKGDVLVPAAAAARGDFTPGFLAAIDRALAFRPEERPRSVAEWAQMLRDEAETEAAKTRPPNDAAPTAALPEGPAAGRIEARDAPTEVAAAPGPAPAPARSRALVAALAAGALAALGAGAWWVLRPGEAPAPVVIAEPAGPGVTEAQTAGSAAEAARGREQAGDARSAAEEAAAPQRAEADRLAAEAAEAAQREAQAEAARRAAEAEAAREQAAARDRERVASLLAAAERDVAALRLSAPGGNNALERYREVLAIDPGNAAAEAGLATVAGKYLELAAAATAAGQLEKAQGLLDRALGVTPDSAGVAEARRALAADRAALEAKRQREAEQADRARAERERIAAQQAQIAKLQDEIEALKQGQGAAPAPAPADRVLKAVVLPFAYHHERGGTWGKESLFAARVAQAVRAAPGVSLIGSHYGRVMPEGALSDPETVWRSGSGFSKEPDVERIAVAAEAAGVDVAVTAFAEILGPRSARQVTIAVYVVDVRARAVEVFRSEGERARELLPDITENLARLARARGAGAS